MLTIWPSRVATGYGQPPSTLYDWTLSWSESVDPNFKLPENIRSRLEVEKFCDKVTKGLYTNERDPVGLYGSQERSTLISFLSRDFSNLEQQLKVHNDCKVAKVMFCVVLMAANQQVRYNGLISSRVQPPPAPLRVLRRPNGQRLPRASAISIPRDDDIPRNSHEPRNGSRAGALVHTVLHLPDDGGGRLHVTETVQELLRDPHGPGVHQGPLQPNGLGSAQSLRLEQRSPRASGRGSRANVAARWHAVAEPGSQRSRRLLNAESPLSHEHVPSV